MRLLMWVLWLCKDAYKAALCKASVIDSLILQSVLDPEGFLHAELGDKETTATLQERQHIPDTHTL